MLHKLYLEASGTEKLSSERVKEIQEQLKEYSKRTEEIRGKSLNNADFAYFYEMSIMDTEYIDTINKKLSNQNQ